MNLKTLLEVSTLGVVLVLPDASGFAPRASAFRTFGLASKPVLVQPLQAGTEDLDIHSLNPKINNSGKKLHNPTPWIASAFQDSNTLKAATAASLMALALALAPLDVNAAASGGRMGGSFSRSAPSTRISPSRSSYGGGSYSGYSRPYTSYSRTNVIVAPTVTPYYSPAVPYYSPITPVYGGGGVVSYGNPFGGLFNIMLFGLGAYAVLNVLSGSFPSMSEGSSVASALGPGTSVAQVSVALDVPDRDDPNSILQVLDRLSQTAKTDSRVGIQNLTSQVALELLRRKSSISSAFSSSKHFSKNTEALRAFERTSIQERSKFEQETVSKFGGVDYAKSGRSTASTSKATMAVITILIAIDGDSTQLPRIKSVGDVEDALRKIATDSRTESCLQSAEILWTPESPSESLTFRDVVADYPELVTV